MKHRVGESGAKQQAKQQATRYSRVDKYISMVAKSLFAFVSAVKAQNYLLE